MRRESGCAAARRRAFGKEAADAAEALGKGAGDEIDLVFDAERFREAPTRFSHDPEAMGIIKEEEGAVAPHHFAKLAERATSPSML